MYKKRRIWVNYCLCILLFIAAGQLFRGQQIDTQATGLTNEVIQQKEAEIKQAQDLKQSLQSGLTDVKKIKEQLEASKNDLAKYIVQLDGQLTTIETKISELRQLIEDKEKEIEQAAIELENAIEVQEGQYEAMKKRIRFMYETDDTFYIELLLSVESFSDMLNKAGYIESLSAYDRKMLEQYIADSEYIALCKEGLEEEKELLDEAKKTVEEEQAALNSLISEKERQIVSVSSDIQSKEAAIKEYEAEIAAQNSMIQALEKAVAEEKKRLAQENARKYDGGIFKWPAPSYTRISDPYGMRMHPTLGVEQFHNGVDMAAPGGSSILAAYDGTVVAADYSSTMGNYIMLDHGDGVYTIYMHASALYVSKGAEVDKGQKIAAVGSTGRSTGNHLHFSVRVNGSYVNPMSYF